MALQHDRVLEVADAIKVICDQTSGLLMKLDQVLTCNSNLAIDWGAAPENKPAYINEEANGNLSGRTFSRQEVSNAIGSLDLVRKLLTNQNIDGTTGDHLGNLNKLARPLT